MLYIIIVFVVYVTSYQNCFNGFACSLKHVKDDEFIFETKRGDDYMLPEEIICKKYRIEPTHENQEKLKESIQRRVYSFRSRDSKKKERCISFDDALKLDDYLINTVCYYISQRDEELQKSFHLNKKRISDLTSEQKLEVSNYITTNKRPVMLYKSYGNSKLLVNEIPEFKTASYNELCDLLLSLSDECYYCKCKLTLLNESYITSGLTFDAIIPLYGHSIDNITLCCSLCNSTKNFKNTLDTSL